MIGESVLYNGQQVPKEHFRTFVYGLNNSKKLVNSWKEFENAVSSGLWFANKESIPKVDDKPIVQPVLDKKAHKKERK